MRGSPSIWEVRVLGITVNVGMLADTPHYLAKIIGCANKG